MTLNACQVATGSVFPLSWCSPAARVGDRRFGRPPRRLPHEHRARLGRRLNARRSVDEVTGDHALALGADRDGRLSREDARARANPRSKIGNCADEIERRPHCPFGVVLLRNGRPPDGHHRVTDELLHGSAVELDQRLAGVEVAGQQLTSLLGVAAFRGAREADEVSEENGDEPSFGDWSLAHGDWSDPAFQRGTALAAEPHSRLVPRSAGGARLAKQRTAAAAELAPRAVLSAAAPADRHAIEPNGLRVNRKCGEHAGRTLHPASAPGQQTGSRRPSSGSPTRGATPAFS